MEASSIGELLSSMTRPVIDRDLDEVRAAAVVRSVFCGVAGCCAAGFSFGVGLDSCAFAPIAIARAKVNAMMKTLFIYNILMVESALNYSFVFVLLFA